MAVVQTAASVEVVEVEQAKLALMEDRMSEVTVVMAYPIAFPGPLYTMPEAEAEAGMAMVQERAGMAVVEQVLRSALKHLQLEQMGLVVEVAVEVDPMRPVPVHAVDRV